MVAAVVVHYLGSLRGLKSTGRFPVAAKIPPTKAMAIAALPTAFHPDFAFDSVVFKSGSDSGSSLRLHCKKYLCRHQ